MAALAAGHGRLGLRNEIRAAGAGGTDARAAARICSGRGAGVRVGRGGNGAE